jgi:hypothetical protein
MSFSSLSSNLGFFLIATACVLPACIDLPSLNSPLPDPRLEPPVLGPVSDPNDFFCPTCCPDWGCGSNSAWLGENLAFHELDASGVHPNNLGLFVLDFRDASDNLLELSIDHDELIGTCTVKDSNCAYVGQVLKRDALRYAKLGLLDKSALNKTLYTLRIESTSTTPFWNDPTSESAPTYEFTYTAANKRDAVNLCSHNSDPKDPLHGVAMVFRGDRYDAKHKTVTIAAADDPWFNIACAGTAIGKLHLLRHTSAADRDGTHLTSQQDRQALLKMLTADYCGTGQVFTVDGQPLMYSYKQPWVLKVPCDVGDKKYWQQADSIDAVWSSNHAMCLDVPRMSGQPGYGSGFRQQIVAQCSMAPAKLALGPCPSDLLASLQKGDPQPWSDYAVAANPQPDSICAPAPPP